MAKILNSIFKTLKTDEYKEKMNEYIKDEAYTSNPSIINKLNILNVYINGNLTQETVSDIFKIERKSLHNWGKILLSGEICKLDTRYKKKSEFNDEIKDFLVSLVDKTPSDYGYVQCQWDGYLIKDLILKEFGIDKCYITIIKWIKLSGLRFTKAKKNSSNLMKKNVKNSKQK